MPRLHAKTLGWFLLYGTVASAQTGYLESGACAECHGAIADSYARSGMARSFGVVRQGDPKPADYQHKLSEQIFSILQRDGKPFLKRHQLGFDGAPANVVERQIDYWFGSGDRARSYVSRTPSGSLIELPVTWYAQNNGTLAMSPAYDRPDHAGFSRKITYRCLFCHNGYPEIEAGADSWDGATTFPGKLPEGIDCQRCHGPGASHAAAARQGRPVEQVRRAIVNPARLAPERRMEVCLQCHLETTSSRLPSAQLRTGRGVFSYRPGEPIENYMLFFDHAPRTGHDDKFEVVGSAYRLRKSACFIKSAGAMTCTTCHNPHDAPRGEAAMTHFDQSCRGCHTGDLPHLKSRDCASCHMPKRAASDAPMVLITDHFIRKQPDTSPVDEKPYRGEVTLYYPPALPPTPENEFAMAVAQVSGQSNLNAGLPRLEAVIAKYAPKNGSYYYELAEGYRHAGRIDKAIPFYQEACRRSPGNWRYFHALGVGLSTTGNLDGAVQALRRALTLAPKEVTVLQALGEAYSRNSRPREAMSQFQAALAIEPDSAAAHNGVGTALLRLGDLPGAEKSLQEAVRLRPESAAMRVNLATLLSRRGNATEAKHHFEAALRTDSSYAEGRSAYGTALAAHGDLAGAREQYTEALRLSPDLPTTRNNLGAVLLQLGDLDGAVREYRAALAARPDAPTTHYNLAVALAAKGELADAEQHLTAAIKQSPDYFDAHLKLGLLLSARGAKSLAEPHLKKALASPNPQLRKAAADALSEK